MKTCWYNVKKDNRIVTSEEVSIPKKTIIKEFESLFSKTSYSFVKWNNVKRAPYECVISDGLKRINVLIYLKWISNAGWEKKPHIKRVQVSNPKNLNLDFFRYDDMNKISLIIGYYNYEKPIFVSWNPLEYRRHNTNRSCYVDVENLINGYNNRFESSVCMGQKIVMFTPDRFQQFLDSHMSKVSDELDNFTNKLYDIAMDYYRGICEFDDYWDGKDKITEMRIGEGKNWKQTEWPGFYFEFIMEQFFGKEKFFNIQYENMTFDMFDYIPWDLKVHSTNSTSKNKIITNDISAIKRSITDYGKQGFIIMEGESIYETHGEFREWHNELKGNRSKYQIENAKKNKPHRRRKAGFRPTGVTALVFDEEDIKKHPQFQQGFLNSNGKKRNAKMVIDKSKLEKKNILFEKTLKV